jgi:hypothetical protein
VGTTVSAKAMPVELCVLATALVKKIALNALFCHSCLRSERCVLHDCGFTNPKAGTPRAGTLQMPENHAFFEFALLARSLITMQYPQGKTPRH